MLATKIYPVIQSDGSGSHLWPLTGTIIDQGEEHQVKHITVEPGASLSLQYHQYRSKNWLVVKGIAEVIINDDALLLGPNESVQINKGDTHRLINKGDKTLLIIEVQCGDYPGEDDIVRLDDQYGRETPIETIDWIREIA